jgi:hypothetical protein
MKEIAVLLLLMSVFHTDILIHNKEKNVKSSHFIIENHSDSLIGIHKNLKLMFFNFMISFFRIKF